MIEQEVFRGTFRDGKSSHKKEEKERGGAGGEGEFNVHLYKGLLLIRDQLQYMYFSPHHSDNFFKAISNQLINQSI